MKRSSWKAWGAAALGSVILISCGTTAHVEKDESVNFNNYKSFAWIQDGDGDQKVSSMTESKIRTAVTQELQEKGWKEVKNNPDVILNYDILVERASKEKREPVYSRSYSRLVYNPYTRRYATIYYPSQFLGYESYEELVKEGTITISMIDSKSDKVVWQGWTTDQVNNTKNLTSKEIQRAVNSIFKKFDVAKR
jgi:hypothetical protein